MAILDALEPRLDARVTLHAAAMRRLRYLAGRASGPAEQPDDAAGAERTPPDQAAWTRATLWLEAVETALFMGDVGTARNLLPGALNELDALGHPLGAALRQFFSPGTRNADRSFARAEPSELAPSARVWAGFFLSPALLRLGEDADLPPRSTRLAPVGRMGVPEIDVLTVARWRAEGRGRPGDGPRGGEEDLHASTAAILNRLLDRHYMALSQERYNTHLWRRLLVRAPLFDLELAVLLSAGLERHDERDAPAELAVQGLLPEARAFGHACLDLVARLRG